MNKKISTHNLIKNIILIGLLIPSYFEIKKFIQASDLVLKEGVAGDMVLIASILAVVACFGNFGFTYEKVDYEKNSSIIIAHSTTGLLMFILGLSLEITALFSQVLVGNFFILNLSLLLLYVSVVLYDFWDLRRIGMK